MIKTEILNSGTLIRHYSDDPAMELLQEDTGLRYSEAVDINPTAHTYAEVERPIEDGGQEATIEDYQAALRRMGVQV